MLGLARGRKEGDKSTGRPELKVECRNHDSLAKNSVVEQTGIWESEVAG